MICNNSNGRFLLCWFFSLQFMICVWHLSLALPQSELKYFNSFTYVQRKCEWNVHKPYFPTTIASNNITELSVTVGFFLSSSIRSETYVRCLATLMVLHKKNGVNVNVSVCVTRLFKAMPLLDPVFQLMQTNRIWLIINGIHN